jgi:hypothetical protein
MEGRDITQIILNLSTRFRQVISSVPQPHYPPGKALWLSVNMKLGGSHSQYDYSGVEKILLPLVKIKQ